VSADHGEEFGDHGGSFHARTLYEELLRIPLIIWGPGIPARSLAERGGLIDLGPTILDLFGQPIPEQLMGQSLLPLLAGERAKLERPLLAEARLKRALYTADGRKVIEDGRLKTVEIYDLAADPEERHNLFAIDRPRARAALAKLHAFFQEHELSRPGYRLPYKC